MRLTPLLHGEFDGIYDSLRERARGDERLQEALTAFENAWERQSTEWSQINAKDAIRTASLLAENMLVTACGGRENEFTRARPWRGDARGKRGAIPQVYVQVGTAGSCSERARGKGWSCACWKARTLVNLCDACQGGGDHSAARTQQQPFVPGLCPQAA
jgi:hypothetical protein